MGLLITQARMFYRVSLFSEITRGIIFFVFVALMFVSRISHPTTKINFEISQEISLDALASLRLRFFTLRVQNKVKWGYLLRRQEWFIEFRFSPKITRGIIFFVFVALGFVSRISHPTTKISFEISQEISLNALASLKCRFLTLRVQNKVKSGY